MNWHNLIQDLLDAGWTQQRIADRCGCNQASISLLYTGARKGVEYELGHKLVQLHAYHIKRKKS